MYVQLGSFLLHRTTHCMYDINDDVMIIIYKCNIYYISVAKWSIEFDWLRAPLRTRLEHINFIKNSLMS